MVLQKHDAEINKKYIQECSKTGGGTGPAVPQGKA